MKLVIGMNNRYKVMQIRNPTVLFKIFRSDAESVFSCFLVLVEINNARVNATTIIYATRQYTTLKLVS